MTPAQIAKRTYNERDYDLHGQARRAYARAYYWNNRERVLAQKQTARNGINGSSK